PGDDDIVVLLDPGMAFGTGTHPTTQTALRLLETLELEGRTIFDVRTGSGIIAIAAAKLGARKVDGVDIDPVSVRQAQTNIDLNGVRDTVTIWQSGMEATNSTLPTYDIVVANIIARVLVDISEQVAASIDTAGTLVLSGIIDSKEQSVIDCYAALGFEMIDRQQIEDWIGHIWRRR